ncbi:hypothetical protein IMCC20628_02609 [Hoeflea sp. IMCC20628]|uniref:hypothetical protein n=1 Tax=Hoeflea sp. IMCC20628 TaxID=1620421 RepID=UPI00063ACD47|nr:hypothetical protein [Hoeflea sp. IMCC20628]AKI01307.1 hypothetical protein IMCC20628_02609 [Hoeflea sp. IMCC20628]
MTRYSTIRAFTLLSGTILATAVALPALAQSDELFDSRDQYTTYAKTAGGCKSGDLINWSPTSISGTDFQCVLETRVPGAGSGLDAIDSTCMIKGEKVSARVVLGLGVRPDHFSVEIPDFLFADMYPCTPVEGLEGTN